MRTNVYNDAVGELNNAQSGIQTADRNYKRASAGVDILTQQASDIKNKLNNLEAEKERKQFEKFSIQKGFDNA